MLSQVAIEAKRLNIRYIVRATINQWNNVIDGQWLCLTTAETTMIVFRTQIAPFPRRVYTAVRLFASATTMRASQRMGFLLTLMIVVVSISLADIHALVLTQSSIVFPSIALAFLGMFAHFWARKISLVACSQVLFHAGPLFIFACDDAQASFTLPTITISTFLTPTELVKRLVNAALDATLERWYTIHRRHSLSEYRPCLRLLQQRVGFLMPNYTRYSSQWHYNTFI